MNLFEEKTIKRDTIFKGKIIDVYVDQVELPNGKTASREIVKHPGAVAVMAFTDKQKMIMVKQYRKPLERSLVEIPAGKLEKGEEPKSTAKRELEEETGYSCDDLEHIASFYTSPGFADEIIHLFVAKGLKKIENPLQPDEDEFVHLLELSLEEALEYVQSGRIYDAKTMYAVQFWQLQKVMEK
jgi:ADP-ribose pyrophosphatase